MVAVAGLIYELVIATTSTFLLGDSIRQFSFVIGLFLTAMGLGAWLSRFVDDVPRVFIASQITLALVGGFSAPALFLAFAYLGETTALLVTLLLATGLLSGLEIPLIARLLEQLGARRFRFENVLSLDYLGALIASLLFPLVLVPNLGLVTSSLAFGALNLAVAGGSLLLLWERTARALLVFWLVAAVLIGWALLSSERLVSLADRAIFEDNVIFSQTTPYQKIVVTKHRERVRLYLDNGIQFDSLDEHRYHELLVHPAMLAASRAQNVLILGGGDGLAAREVLRHENVAHIDLVDLDPAVTNLFTTSPLLNQLNDNALSDPRLRVHNQDAWRFLEARLDAADRYDVVIADLPDPKSFALSKLYTAEFYRLVALTTSADAVIVTQAGSPTFARQAFWSVEATLAEQFARTLPYHGYLPSFGDWGFVWAAKRAASPSSIAPGLADLDLEYLTAGAWDAAQRFSGDSDRIDAEVNRLTSHKLVEYYLQGWEEWFL